MASRRQIIFFTHLLLTITLLALILGMGYLGWYAWPAWYVLNADNVIALWVVSSLLLGPFASLLVASPSKPIHLLRMNLLVIVLLQLGTMGISGWTLWHGRPLFYILTIDRIELITASDFDAHARRELLDKHFDNPYNAISQVAWVFAPLPDSAEEKEAIILSAIIDGKDITQMPSHFRPWSAGVGDLRRQLHPLSDLTDVLKLDANQIQQLVLTMGQNEAELGWLRLDGSRRGGVIIFHRLSGEPLRFLARR